MLMVHNIENKLWEGYGLFGGCVLKPIPTARGEGHKNLVNLYLISELLLGSSVLFCFPFCYKILQDPHWILRVKDERRFSRKIDRNSINNETPVKLIPFHALSILAGCMANLSELLIVFSSSALIQLNKDTFKGHLKKVLSFT